MRSPFRVVPPRMPDRSWVDRPRILDLLDGRFERRVTVLRAGAGFGKSVALLQAIQRNRVDAAGTDCWLACFPGDKRAAELASGLCAAVSVAPGSRDPVAAICDAVWAESPRDVALLIDDAHHVTAGGTGAELLARVLSELPHNGHLVLATRTAPALALERWRSSGDVCWIEEEDLAFDSQERASFLAMRGVRGDVEALPAWPAVLELGAGAGGREVRAYLWQEVLGALSARDRRDLARVATLDWVDPDRVRWLCGSDTRLGEVLAALPLASRQEDGATRLHRLWSEVLAEVDPAWHPDEVALAAAQLVESGHPREAIALCQSGAFAPDEVLRSLLVGDWLSVPLEELESCLALLSPAEREAPLGRLLDGCYRSHLDHEMARSYLDSAFRTFADAGESELALVALRLLIHLAVMRESADELAALAEDAARLPGAEAEMVRDTGRACAALARGDHGLALDSVRSMRSAGIDAEGSDVNLATIAWLDAGEPARAIAEVDAAIAKVSPVFGRLLALLRGEAVAMRGQLDAASLRAFDGGLPGEFGNSSYAVQCLSVMAFQNAVAGRSEIARAHLADARRRGGASISEGMDLSLAAAELAVDVAQGHEERAALSFDAALARNSERPLSLRHVLRAAPLATLVSEAARKRFASVTLGPCFAEGVAATEALRHFRESGDASLAASLAWNAPEPFAAFLVPPILFELAMAAASTGQRDALHLAEWLAEHHRAVLRRAADSPHASLAEVARDLLRRIPARPAHDVELRVLGPLQLARDGRLVDDPILRRARVRQLVHYLVERRSSPVAALRAAIWPEMDEAAVTNNLRVNLGHLTQLLEPERGRDEPSYFVSRGATIALRIGEGLGVDADRFDALADRAETEERNGRPGAALAALEEALALVRGPYLEDAEDAVFAQATRTRLEARFLSCALRAAALRLGLGEFERALEWIQRALATDELSEAAYLLEARVHLRREDRRSARAAVERCAAALGAAGLAVGDETRRLARRLGIAAL